MGASIIKKNFSNFILYKKYFMNPLKSFFPILRSFSGYIFNSEGMFPLNITLSLTTRCNNRCYMCYDKEYLNQKQTELSYEDIKNFIDDISGHKPTIFITGGEPFLRKDIFKVMEYIKKKGLSEGICTNGTLLDKDKIRKLAKLDPENIIFSIHGNQSSHDIVTGVPGSFDNATSAIKEFCRIKKNTHVMVNCAVLPENIDDLEELAGICKRLGVDTLRFEHLSYLTPKEKKKHDLVWKIFSSSPIDVHQHVDNRDFKAMGEKMIALFRKRYDMRVLFKPYLNPEEIRQWYSSDYRFSRKCMFLWLTTFIRANGDVIPCQTYEYILGNIRKESLKKIFNSKRAKKFRKRIRQSYMPACSRCCKL